ncbi:hypothetical protein [Leptolyngbya sp. 7M]|uniref:hypothetical protein n=1 Tax=Leptolyngbya sp. 7M TaxID=2812896 RepID=UPI001B8DA474|nr:hypothetical protein [Leptolyngbya sp. 7M]QYO68268.1 hypothetical protein JVX88_16775 [Leptolyngbya sp. 7M]
MATEDKEVSVLEGLGSEICIRSDDIGFLPEEMPLCPNCARRNAPGRSNCIYCGEGFRTGASAYDASNEELEIFSEVLNGFNVVIGPQRNSVWTDQRNRLKMLTGFDLQIADIADLSQIALPVARYSVEHKAKQIGDELSTTGLEVRIVSDALLEAAPPMRIRCIEILPKQIQFTNFNTGQVYRFHPSEIKLIVSGTIREERVHATVKKKRNRPDKVDKQESVNLTPMIDLYTAPDVGFRVNTNGFDFSCLGVNKAMLAADNIERLLVMLGEFCPEAPTNNHFDEVTGVLCQVWDLESHKDHRGVLRIGLENKGRTTVTSRNNLRQFTKYSRLQARYI